MGYSGKVKHSPAGKEYKALGEKEYYKRAVRTQKRLTRQKRIDALSPAPHDPKEPKTQKERGGYISPSSGSGSSGGMLSYSAWLKKNGKGSTTNTHRQWRSEKRNFGKPK